MQTQQKPITEGNEFFNPSDYREAVLGFFEEIYDAQRNKGYGVRMVEGLPTRALGNAKRVQYTFTAPFKVLRNFKEVTIKASKERPVTCFLALHVLTGRTK